MYYGSDEFNNAIENTQGNSLKTRLKFSDVEIIELASSIRYYGGSNDSDDISIGNTNMAYVEVSAFTDKLLTGREFLLESGVKLSDGTYEYAPIGYFTVQTPSGDYDEVTFKAYDRMQKFEKPYSSTLSYPTDSAAVLDELCTICGVELVTPITNTITITENLKGYTCREILGYIAGIHGFFACIDRFGKLNLCWYSDTPIEKPLRCVWAFEKSQEQYEVEKVEVAKDSESAYTSGDGVKMLYHSNPYATQDIVDSLFTKFGGYTYMPAEIEMLDDIRLDPWDVVQLTYFDNQTYLIPTMVIEHDIGASCTIIKAVGKLTESEYNFTGPTVKYLNRMSADLLTANRILATKVDAEYVQAYAITTDNFVAIQANIKNAVIEEVEADFVRTENLDVVQAEIKNAVIGDLSAEFATVDQLTATNAQVSTLDAGVANINTLIFGSASGTVIQTEFSNSVIAQLGKAQIKSAMIQNVSADKVTAGTIYTDDVTIQSKNGQMILSDNTIQISDGTRARVQIGKDASNDYSINIWDENGNLMFSKGGITDKAIKEAIIRNDMISNAANINASKLDIDSLFSEINGSTNTIKSTKVYFDSEGQTLDIAFNRMSNAVDGIQYTLSSQGTDISVIQGQLGAKIWQQDIITSIDKIEIGGRNRLLNSAKWDDFTCPVAVTIHNTSMIPVVAREVVTISYDVKATIECQGQSILVQYYDSSEVRTGYEWAIDDVTTDYTRRAVTVTIPDGVRYISIGLRSNQNVEKTYRKLKVESGNKATDWTPAPEDVDNEITTLSTKYSELQMDLTGFKTTVAAEYTTLGEFKALDIGGTNILRYMNGYTEENKYVLTANKDNYNKLTPGRVQLEAGVEYTFSCKTDGLWLTGSSGDSVEAYLLLDGVYTIYFGLTTNPCTFTPTKSGLYTLRLDVNQNGATHSFWNIQIEKGNKATDWRQNLCDTEVQITSIGTTATQTLEKFNWIVKSGTSSTNFTLTDKMAMLTAQVISLNANVQVSGDMIIAGAITGDKIAAGAITADKITVHDLSALGATIGGWQVKSTYISNDALDSEGYVRRAYIQSMSVHAAEKAWVFSVQKSKELGDYDGVFTSAWRVEGSGNMYSQGLISTESYIYAGKHIQTDDVIKVYGGTADGEYSFIKGKLSIGTSSYNNKYKLLIGGDTQITGDLNLLGTFLGNVSTMGDVITTQGASLNNMYNRFKWYSTSEINTRHDYGMIDAGLYLVILIDSLSPTNRARPSLATIYVDDTGYGWANFWGSTTTKITNVEYNGGALHVCLEESRYISMGYINLIHN